MAACARLGAVGGAGLAGCFAITCTLPCLAGATTCSAGLGAAFAVAGLTFAEGASDLPTAGCLTAGAVGCFSTAAFLGAGAAFFATGGRLTGGSLSPSSSSSRSSIGSSTASSSSSGKASSASPSNAGSARALLFSRISASRGYGVRSPAAEEQAVNRAPGKHATALLSPGCHQSRPGTAGKSFRRNLGPPA